MLSVNETNLNKLPIAMLLNNDVHDNLQHR